MGIGHSLHFTRRTVHFLLVFIYILIVRDCPFVAKLQVCWYFEEVNIADSSIEDGCNQNLRACGRTIVIRQWRVAPL